MRPKKVKEVEPLSKESPWHSRTPVLELTYSSNAKTLPLPFHPDLRERVLVFLTLHWKPGRQRPTLKFSRLFNMNMWMGNG